MAGQLEREPALRALTWIASDGVEDDEGRHFAPRAHNELAMLQYTSGSTSEPKGVMLSHANILWNLASLVKRGGGTIGDRWVTWLPPYHDMGLIGAIFLPLAAGMETTLLSPSAFLQRPFRWLAAITRHAATVSGGPNFAYELCLRRIDAARRESLDLRSWRVAFCGAERVRAETLEKFAQAFGPAGFRKDAFVPCYGLAEATLGVSFGPVAEPFAVKSLDEKALGAGRAEEAPPGEPGRMLVGCGKPFPGSRVAIVEPETRVLQPDGIVGEIWVKSPSVAAGYWDNEALTDRTFRARLADDDGETYLRTGDLGFSSEGELFVTGRIKDLIILRGTNHYPEDIEATVEGVHPGLRAGRAIAFSFDDGGEEKLVIVHEIDPAHARSSPEIVALVRDAVAEGHELSVADVVLVGPSGIPRTSSGKVQRSRCRELYLKGELPVLGRAESTEAAGADTGSQPLADRIASTMAELLGVEPVLPDDDLFWLGGHSLIATQLASRLSATLGVEVPLRLVFQAPTARSLAARIQALPRAPKPAPVVPVVRGGRLPLSFSQERMWFLHQLEPKGAAYNVAGAVGIDGAIDTAALHRSFEEILKRHEVLRSNYENVDGQPRLTIADRKDLPLTVADLSASPDAEAAAMTAASELARSPFDIARDSLVRGALYRVGPHRHILAVSMHHLVTDAWSMGVLVADLLRFYDAFSAGHEPPRGEEALTYVDYAAWQREELGAERLADDLAYWKRELAGAEPLELPSDRSRSRRRSSEGELEPIELSADLLASLRELGAARGATLFMVMLAAFEVVLHRHTGQTDIVVGIPVANRNRLASERLIGTLVNTLALRVRFEPDIGFAELLRRVREVCIEAYAHQDLPFERLVWELVVERRADQSPLVQVMFDFQNAPVPVHESPGLRMQPLVLSRGAAQFDLSLLILDTELGQTAGVEYRSDLFDRDTMRRFAQHYVCVLEAILVDPNQPISRIGMLDAAEQSEILARASATCRGGTPAKPVHMAFADRAASAPDAVAVRDARGALSYGDLHRRASELAANLHHLGVGPGDRVAIFLERSPAVVVALLAVLQAGAAYVPIDPRYPPARTLHVLEDAAPRIILTEEGLRERLPPNAARIILMTSVLEDPADGAILPEALDDDRAAYVIYTSGSTGRPKGVEVSVRALANFLRSMEHTPGIGPDDRLLSVTTIAFDIAGLELFLPLVAGACVYIAPSDIVADGLRLAQLVREVEPTIMQATPATWRLLVEAGWQGDRRLKVLSGGEALPRELADQLLERAGSVWNMYGPTETTIWSTVHRVGPDTDVVPIGSPIDETRVYVLGRHGELCPDGVTGEIHIGGAGVANGYFQRPDLTRERFIPDPFAPGPDARMYRTGDLGRYRADGTLEHRGRVDEQIKIRGFRVEPGEIEAVLQAEGKVREAVVIAREDRPHDVRLVAYYAPASSEAGKTATLRELLQRRLPDYMVPSAFVALDALPRTPNGKIDRARLAPPEADDAVAPEEHVAPRDALEMRLAELWKEILGAPDPGIRDNFFAVGGHSLLAVRMFSRIEREFGVPIELSMLFEAPTIETLAERIRDRSSSPKAFSFLVPVQRGGALSPLYCVHGAGGNVINLAGVARHLGAQRPFYALQARGVDGKAPPFTRIEDAAEAYVAELRAFQPEGPYFLTGYCGGGAIAFEMARMLREQGESVAMLALLDTYRPGISISAARYRQLVRGISTKGLAYVWQRLTARLRHELGVLWSELRVRCHRMLGRVVPHELRDLWLTRAFFRAAAHYRPRVYPGKLIVLRAKDADPLVASVGRELGWTGLARGGIEVHDVPGNHDNLIEEPNAPVLAATLKGCLESAEGNTER
jgi:amino acid adenylation domain-containing protein